MRTFSAISTALSFLSCLCLLSQSKAEAVMGGDMNKDSVKGADARKAQTEDLSTSRDGLFVQTRSKNDRLLRRAAKTPAGAYTALVAFGASYTDNAHPRPSQYAASLRQYYPWSNYGGRYSNGPVAVEYMVASGTSPALKKGSTAVQLLDYAYGGSVIQNGLTGTSSSFPASGDQISTYLSALSSRVTAIGDGRVLHYFNSGINPVAQIWTNALNAGFSSSAVALAQNYITQNTNTLAAQIRSIHTNALTASRIKAGADFMIVGIPPLEIVPTYGFQCNQDPTALGIMKTLAAQYNSELKSFVAAFKTEVAGKGGKVWFYDLAELWYSMYASPSYYGFTVSPITSTCYDSSTGSLCTNPSSYLYMDTLHPVTTVHKMIASKINNVIKSG